MYEGTPSRAIEKLIKANWPEVIRKCSALDDLLSAESKKKNGSCEGQDSGEQSDIKRQPMITDSDSLTTEQGTKIGNILPIFISLIYLR